MAIEGMAEQRCGRRCWAIESPSKCYAARAEFEVMLKVRTALSFGFDFERPQTSGIFFSRDEITSKEKIFVTSLLLQLQKIKINSSRNLNNYAQRIFLPLIRRYRRTQ